MAPLLQFILNSNQLRIINFLRKAYVESFFSSLKNTERFFIAYFSEIPHFRVSEWKLLGPLKIGGLVIVYVDFLISNIEVFMFLNT